MRVDVPVDDGVFAITPDGPRLLGTRCTACGTYTFPRQSGCPSCTGTEMLDVQLAPRGTLWTWTVQGFPPKAPPYIGESDPARFVPFGVGYVELPGQLKVEGRLTESDPSRLQIGMQMDLVVVPLSGDDAGNRVVTYAFRPICAAGS